MSSEKKKLLLFCAAGFVFVNLLGALSHFFYEWSGDSVVAGIFFPVNESVWEHLKLVIFPTFVWFALGTIYMRGTPNYVFACFVCVLSGLLIIPAVYYTYTSFTGESILPVDIASFTASVFIGFVAVWFIAGARRVRWLGVIGALGIAAVVAVYLTFTLYPPQANLFRDPMDGTYGFGLR